MKKQMKTNFLFLALLLTLILLISSCNTKNDTSSKEEIPATKDTPPITSGFSTQQFCDLPKQIAPNTPFGALGGCKWGKSVDLGDKEMDFSCSGEEMIKLQNQATQEIAVEFSPWGGEKSVHYLSLEYTANNIGGLDPNESKFRQQYADFCDKVAEKLYGVKLSEKFRKRLLNESTYSPKGVTNLYGEKVGNGYITLSTNKVQSTMILLYVTYYSSEDEFQKYKDS